MSVHQRHQRYEADQTQFFDELISQEWDSYKSESWDQTRRFEVELLFKRVQPKTIMDIGCGCGFHDVEMAQYPFVQRVDAIDPSSESIRKAEQYYPHPKVKRWAAGVSDLPSSTKYDLVVSYQVFEHLDCPEDYLAKCREIVSDTGTVAIIMPNGKRLRNRQLARKGLPPELIDVMHFHEYTVDETAALASRQGLKLNCSFGYHLEWGKFSHTAKLKLGSYLPSLANGIGVLLVKA